MKAAKYVELKDVERKQSTHRGEIIKFGLQLLPKIKKYKIIEIHI